MEYLDTKIIKYIQDDYIIEIINNNFRYTKFTCFTDMDGNKLEMTYNSNTEHNDINCKIIYIIYKKCVGAISRLNINGRRNIIIGQPRINWNEELEMKEDGKIYNIDEIKKFLKKDINDLMNINIEITDNMISDLLEKAGLNVYNRDNYMRGKTVIDMYNKLNSVGKEKIECCICYNDYTVEDIIITKCCKNLYCEECILRLKKCGVCNRDF